jgi:hypothetical protein
MAKIQNKQTRFKEQIIVEPNCKKTKEVYNFKLDLELKDQEEYLKIEQVQSCEDEKEVLQSHWSGDDLIDSANHQTNKNLFKKYTFSIDLYISYDTNRFHMDLNDAFNSQKGSLIDLPSTNTFGHLLSNGEQAAKFYCLLNKICLFAVNKLAIYAKSEDKSIV